MAYEDLNELWSVPPIIDARQECPEPPASGMVNPRENDQSFVLLQGIVHDIQISEGQTKFFQNLMDNEDDRIEYSFHGKQDGIWMKLNAGTIMAVNRPFYMLNRTNFKGMAVGVVSQNYIPYVDGASGPIVPPDDCVDGINTPPEQI